MNWKPVMIFGFLLLLVTVASPVQAQRDFNSWTPPDGVAIRQGWNIEWFRGGEGRDAGRLAGEAGITWSDTRHGDRGVYLQVVDTNGDVKFADGGLLVVDSTGRQEDPGVWPDPTDGGWFLAWEDFDIWTDGQGQARGDSLGDIYCTKIDAQGRRVWGADQRGVPVCVMPGIQEDVRIVQDGQGGCIIAWRDMRGGDVADIYAMHILNDGRPDPNWTQNGIPVVRAPGAQTNHTADIDGNGGMILGWKDGRQGGNFDIWAQRITPGGDLLWGNREGILICSNAANQESPKLCPDGQGGAFFTWVDDRNVDQTNKDIYAQRVDANGRLMWGPADQGVPLCTEAEEQLGNRIVIAENGAAIVTWEDKRNGGQEYDIYAMKINGVDRMNRVWQPAGGKPVCTAQRNQKEVRLYPDAQGGAYFVWEDERDGGFPEVDIWAQRLNPSGDPVWAENGIPVCRAPGNQNSPLVRRLADGGCFIAWADLRTGSAHLYGQRLRPNGQVAWQEDGRPLAVGLGGNALRPVIHNTGANHVAVTWLDGRFGGLGTFPYVQMVRNTGAQPVLIGPQHGIPVVEVNDQTRGGGISPDAIADGRGGMIFVWEDHRRGLPRYAIYAQRIDAQGNRLWGAGGVRVAEFAYDQNDPRVCSDGRGGAIIAWKALTGDLIYDIYMQRLNAAGQRQWGAEGIQLTDHDDMDEKVETIVSDGENGAVVIWLAANEETDDDLWIGRVDGNGNSQWGEGGGFPLVDEYQKQRDAVLLKHPNGYFATWVDGRDDESGQPQNDIYGQFILPDGETTWTNNGYLICGFEYHQENPTAAVDTDGNIWVAWEDHRFNRTERARDIYLQKMTWQANDRRRPEEVFFALDGVPICAANREQVEPQMISDNAGGVWIIWEDNRDEIVWSNVYGTHLRADGTPYQGWRENGVLICGAFHKQNVPQLRTMTGWGGNGIGVTWEDKRATGKEELSNVFVMRVDDRMVSVPESRTPAAPAVFALESVYPNPFNSQALVTFTNLREGVVKLSLYDMNGRMVKALSEGWWSAGRHVIVLEGSDLAAGSYIVRLEAAGASAERFVNLLK